MVVACMLCVWNWHAKNKTTSWYQYPSFLQSQTLLTFIWVITWDDQYILIVPCLPFITLTLLCLPLSLSPQHQLSDHQPQTATVLFPYWVSSRWDVRATQQPPQPKGHVQPELQQPPQPSAGLKQARDPGVVAGHGPQLQQSSYTHLSSLPICSAG